MPVLTEQQKGLIGIESEPRPAAYPVNEIMAQFWCEMVEDANPIYFDEGYARSTWLKGKFAPPPMILIWRMAPVWPERTQANPLSKLGLEEAGCTATIAVNAVQEYHQPLRYGDALTATTQIASVGDEKTTRLGTGHFVTTMDTFRNQHGQVVGTHSFTLFVYAPHGEDGGARSKEQGGAA
jgi:acyl dehydratase